jgi:two-component system sensor kinase
LLITAELAVKNNLTFILFELLDNGLKILHKIKKVIIEGIVYSEDYYQIDIFDSGVGLKSEELSGARKRTKTPTTFFTV